MTDQGIARVYFNDGVVRTAGHVFIAAKLAHLNPDEFEFGRMFFHKAPQWGYQDINWSVVSVCYRETPYSFVALGERGGVMTYSPGTPPHEEFIADARDYGSLSQVRSIKNTLYACGMQGQVYRRGNDAWEHIDQGILDSEISTSALHLNGIDGTSPSDIYVVGMGGRILHYDGWAWAELDSPTNVHLERVHCVEPGEAYVCGNSGTFLKITPHGIENLSISLEDHFWGLTSFQAKIYLATLKGLYVYDGTTVAAVDTGLEPAIGGYRLDARDGQLWSFGVDDLAYFDGAAWTRVEHADNK